MSCCMIVQEDVIEVMSSNEGDRGFRRLKSKMDEDRKQYRHRVSSVLSSKHPRFEYGLSGQNADSP